MGMIDRNFNSKHHLTLHKWEGVDAQALAGESSLERKNLRSSEYLDSSFFIASARFLSCNLWLMKILNDALLEFITTPQLC